MDNCYLIYNEETKSISTKNVTVQCILSLYDSINTNSTVWLKDIIGETYIFPNGDGAFETLEPLTTYEIEVGMGRKRNRENSASSDEGADELDLQRAASAAYKLATSGPKKKGIT